MVGVGDLESGETFAQRYVIERLLGEGDRKRTYLASDTKRGRLVALSIVKPDAVASDPMGTEREAKVLGRIGSHPNIVSLYDYEISGDGSAQYIVFQYLGGGTLAEYLQATGPLPLEPLLRLGRHLCRGLAHLHDRDLIHRDVSPENIWLDERYVAHLGDFDSAIPATSGTELMPITTSSYASPEELRGLPLDIRADLYSLGGVLHVAASGEKYPGDLSRISARRDLPTGFGTLLASMLSDSPADRPSDAEAVLSQLDSVRHASNVGTLVAAGESDTVEFKSSLHHPWGPLPDGLQIQVDLGRKSLHEAMKEVTKALHHSVTKTIAAFLNSEGGTLLIGVDDTGAAVGIESDFSYLGKGKQSSDGWLLSLRQVIINALGAPGMGCSTCLACAPRRRCRRGRAMSTAWGRDLAIRWPASPVLHPCIERY
jgi:serine/threonine protein kinase